MKLKCYEEYSVAEQLGWQIMKDRNGNNIRFIKFWCRDQGDGSKGWTMHFLNGKVLGLIPSSI